MIAAEGYGRAALQAAAETGLPVWLGMTPARRDDGSLGTPAELGDGDSFEDLLAALASPALAAVTVMHASPEVIPDAIEMTRRCFAGPIGAYAETGNWTPPNWVFDGLTPSQYLQQGHHLGRARRATHRRVLRHRARAHPGPRRTAAPPRHTTRPGNLTRPAPRPTTATAAPCHRAGPAPANNRTLAADADALSASEVRIIMQPGRVSRSS